MKRSLRVPALLFSAVLEYVASRNGADLRRIRVDDPRISAERKKEFVVPAPTREVELGKDQWWTVRGKQHFCHLSRELTETLYLPAEAPVPAAASGGPTSPSVQPEASKSRASGQKRKSSADQDTEPAPTKTAKPSRQADTATESRPSQQRAVSQSAASTSSQPPPLAGKGTVCIAQPSQAKPSHQSLKNIGKHDSRENRTHIPYVSVPRMAAQSSRTTVAPVDKSGATGARKRSRQEAEDADEEDTDDTDDEGGHDKDDGPDENDEEVDDDSEEEASPSQRKGKKMAGKGIPRRSTRGKEGTDKEETEKEKEIRAKAAAEVAKIEDAAKDATVSVSTVITSPSRYSPIFLLAGTVHAVHRE